MMRPRAKVREYQRARKFGAPEGARAVRRLPPYSPRARMPKT
jgi:hypothetical protein